MRRASIVAAAVVAVCAAAAAQGTRFITEKDLFKFTWIADPQISPDGRTVAFVRVTVNEKENRYESSIFTVPSSGNEAPRRLTSGIRDTGPRWSPDSKRIVFVRTAETRTGGNENGTRTQPQLYLLEMDGGEARALTDLPRGAGSPAWSPDGKTIAFTAATGPLRDGREGREGTEKTEGA